jgi:hypothetical protein
MARPGFITVVCAALITTTVPDAVAADIRVTDSAGSSRGITIEGLLATGDFDEFIRLVKDNQGAIAEVYLFSAGGDFTEAMKIGRAMRALELSSRVPARSSSGVPLCDGSLGVRPRDQQHCMCASACFFVHVAGTDRRGEYLAVHRPYFLTDAFGRMSQKEAMKAFDALQRMASEYMDDMGVPQHVQEDVLGTPSDRTLLLDDRTVRTYFSGDLPYRDEWTRNRCSRLTTGERARLANSERPLTAGSAAEARPAQAEQGLRELQTMRGEELACVATVQRETRLAAYEKYFGVRPSLRLP